MSPVAAGPAAPLLFHADYHLVKATPTRPFSDHLVLDAKGRGRFVGCSLQPNAGSQGEYSGLSVIRALHHSRGEAQRDVCLIPSSAHGTNPATATMCGMKVVVVRCDDDGNIDLDDLRAKSLEHADRLAALMVTYPSTHGVFEAGIKDICNLVHAQGGKV